MRTALCIALTCTLLTGCATAYKPNGFSGGFVDMPMAQDTYRIKFNGNGFTTEQQATEMAMLRAAELTLERGFSHFIVVSAGEKIDSTNAWMPGVTSTSVYPTGNGGFRSFTSGGGFMMNIRKPQAELIVRMFHDASTNGLDASAIASALARKYKKAGARGSASTTAPVNVTPTAPQPITVSPTPAAPAAPAQESCEACKRISRGGG